MLIGEIALAVQEVSTSSDDVQLPRQGSLSKNFRWGAPAVAIIVVVLVVGVFMEVLVPDKTTPFSICRCKFEAGRVTQMSEGGR
jgi:uncharacterized membrane protein